MDIQLEQDKLNIIEDYIKSNERYKGHEDLYDKFFQETIKRGMIILRTLDLGNSSTSIYINKIVSSSIIYILREENLLEIEEVPTEDNVTKKIEDDIEKNEPNISSNNEISQQELIQETITSSSTEKTNNKYSQIEVNYNFDYSPVVNGATIKTETLQKFYDSIVIANSEKPSQEYLNIYNLRYTKHLTINQISEKLNIPTENISKVLFELMEEVREKLK